MLIFTNANAGTHDTESIERVAGSLRAEGGIEVTVRPSRSPEDVHRALDGYATGHGSAPAGPGGRPRVVAAGGDGSVHGLVAALHARGELDRYTVGLLPMGTGNDLARNLGIPRARVEAVINHVAYYAGWPVAVSAMRTLDEVWEQMDAQEAGPSGDAEL